MVMLGNIQFSQVEERLGYRLTDEDKELWVKYHSQNASLSEKDSCFHVFDMPTCIVFKGAAARDAIMAMFTSDKIVQQLGTFRVFEQK